MSSTIEDHISTIRRAYDDQQCRSPEISPPPMPVATTNPSTADNIVSRMVTSLLPILNANHSDEPPSTPPSTNIPSAIPSLPDVNVAIEDLQPDDDPSTPPLRPTSPDNIPEIPIIPPPMPTQPTTRDPDIVADKDPDNENTPEFVRIWKSRISSTATFD